MSRVSRLASPSVRASQRRERERERKRGREEETPRAITHQKMILSVLAAIRARHTKVEKPDEFCVRLISMYCGTYGTTPPITMPVEASSDVRLAKLIRLQPFHSSHSLSPCAEPVMLPVWLTASVDRYVREKDALSETLLLLLLLMSAATAAAGSAGGWDRLLLLLPLLLAVADELRRLWLAWDRLRATILRSPVAFCFKTSMKRAAAASDEAASTMIRLIQMA